MEFAMNAFSSSIFIFLLSIMPLRTKKTIYLIRHGQTDYNIQGIIQGSGVDSDLNQIGHEQARAFHRTFGHLQFDAIYTSELRRTHQTVEPFVRSGYNYTSLPELNEINWGKFEGLRSTPDLHAEYVKLVNDWKQGKLESKIPGGESPVLMRQRQETALNILLSKKEEERILICSHGRYMRAFLCTLTGVPLQNMDNFEHSNLCLYVLNQVADEKFEIAVHHETAHLDVLSKI